MSVRITHTGLLYRENSSLKFQTDTKSWGFKDKIDQRTYRPHVACAS